MKTFKTFTLLAALSLLSPTYVSANSALNAKTKAAADTTINKAQEALGLLEKGGDNDHVLELLGEVRQSQKDFRYEQTERLRQKAGDNLKYARAELEKGDTTAAINHLKLTLDQYKEMLTIYNSAH
ncbi:MAG: hypothetical protein ABSB19_20775 [Methylomonas sp.]|jgi:hypothetical protein